MEDNDSLLPFEREAKTVKELFIKGMEEYQANPKLGLPPEKRSVKNLLNSGMIIIDKPPGPTSHQVSAYAKRIIGAKKIGHSGTLDPGVTGVLPMAINRGTRVLSALLPAGKEYVCVMHIHKPVEEYEVRKVFKQFIGKIKQLPPVKSAVKRAVREREIYYLKFLEMKGQDVLFKAGVQGGTYIRKICHDMGEALGTGAHMAELRRTKAGPFGEKDLITLHDLADAIYYYKQENDDSQLRKALKPIEAAITHLPKIWVKDEVVWKLTHGVRLLGMSVVKYTSNLKKESKVAVMTMKNELILLGRSLTSADELKRIIPEENTPLLKSVVVDTEQVLMEQELYPKL